MNGRDKVERIPQTSQPEEAGNSEILDEASQVARGVLESIQALAGTTLVKGVQIHQLHKYAVSKGWLFSDVSRLGTYSDRGSENEIYMSFDNRFVYKLNDFRYADDNLTPFFERIYAHNILFKECAYQLCGFAYNREGKFCALLRQPFILAEREATPEEIEGELGRMGFSSMLEREYFTNGVYDIFDALPNNVLVDARGQLFFIDTIIFRSDKDNPSTYHSLSPRTRSLR